MEQQYSYAFSSHSRNQFAFYGFFGHQADRPPRTTFGRVATDHGDDALFLTVIQKRFCAWALFFVKRSVEAAVLIAVANPANRLWRQRDDAGDPGCAHSFRQLQER